MSLNLKIIGKRIKESRMRRHISQTKLAERIDMSVSYISHIETAKKKASLEVLVRISDELGITVDELLCGNQIHDSDEYRTDMELLMSDCSSHEKRVIFEMVRALKATLRDNSDMIGNKKDNI